MKTKPRPFAVLGLFLALGLPLAAPAGPARAQDGPLTKIEGGGFSPGLSTSTPTSPDGMRVEHSGPSNRDIRVTFESGVTDYTTPSLGIIGGNADLHSVGGIAELYEHGGSQPVNLTVNGALTVTAGHGTSSGSGGNAALRLGHSTVTVGGDLTVSGRYSRDIERRGSVATFEAARLNLAGHLKVTAVAVPYAGTSSEIGGANFQVAVLNATGGIHNFSLASPDFSGFDLSVTIGRLNVASGGTVSLPNANEVDWLTFNGYKLPTAGQVTIGVLGLADGSAFDGGAFVLGAEYGLSGIHLAGAFNRLAGMRLDYAGPGLDPNLVFDLAGLNPGEVMVDLVGGAAADFTGLTDAGKITLTVGPGGLALAPGQRVALMAQEPDGDLRPGAAVGQRKTATLGLTTYRFILESGTLGSLFGPSLDAVYGGLTEEAASGRPYHSYFQGRNAAAVTTRAGGTLLTDRVLPGAARRLTAGAVAAGLDFRGGHSENDTGSRAEVDHFSGALSLARRSDFECSSLIYGVLAEFGHGDYDTWHRLPALGGLTGGGDADYFGGGLFARHTWYDGVYAEGSLRLGRVDNDYSARRRAGADYGYTAAYYGAHVGLGREIAFDADRLDLYARLLWNRVSGEDVTTGAGERISFDDVDSLRARLGGRYTHAFTESLSGYGGLAWEHEFDGEASGRAAGVRVGETTDLKGSSAFLEAGLTLRAHEAFSVDVGVFGLAGQEDAFGGTLTLGLTW